MARAYKRWFGTDTAREISEQYEAGAEVSEILRTYDVPMGSLYRILARAGVPLRDPSHSHPRKTVAQAVEETLSMPSTNGHHVSTPPVRNGMAITVDKFGTVVEAKREGPEQLPAYDVEVEVVTTTTMTVRAASLEEAIHRARTDPKVRKVVGVREVGQD